MFDFWLKDYKCMFKVNPKILFSVLVKNKLMPSAAASMKRKLDLKIKVTTATIYAKTRTES